MTIATRTRPFTSPFPIEPIQQHAIDLRDSHFANRKTNIAKLVAENPNEPDEFYWTMVYDLEHAPTVSSRQRLLEYGIVPVPPQELPDPTSLHDELWTIIEALSKFGVYLLNTRHLTDADLYARLYYKILDEETRMMPPSTEAAEYIDCLHQLDMNYPLAKLLLEPSEPTRPDSTYRRGPLCTMPYTINTRDEYLPAPSWT